MSVAAHVLLRGYTCPRNVHLAIQHELDLRIEHVAAFAVCIRVLEYTGCEILSASTQLLLEFFDHPSLWWKTSVLVEHSIHHKICRLPETILEY